jgi:hypothetical protein
MKNKYSIHSQLSLIYIVTTITITTTTTIIINMTQENAAQTIKNQLKSSIKNEKKNS